MFRVHFVAVHLGLPDRHGDGAHGDETVAADAGRLPRSLPQRHPRPLQSHTALPKHLQREVV